LSEPIRSYQRLFRPERRIYQIEGRALPVPGGVPLRWLAYAIGTLLAVLALGSGSAAVPFAAGAIAALAGFRVGGRSGAVLAAACALAGTWIAGAALSLIDWPLRLLVLPAAIATAGTQATPDGRRANRFARSWVSLRLAPLRRSLGRALPLAGMPHGVGGELWVSPDERSPELRRARIEGPAIVFFAEAVAARRSPLRRRRLHARPLGARPRRDVEGMRRVVLAEGERLEVRA
jgi:hypothetical protein